MNYYYNNIRHVKGDTYSSNLVVDNLGQDLDSVLFTCRDSLNDDESNVLFQKELFDGILLEEYDPNIDRRIYSVRVSPNDTKDLQSGTYFYDMQVGVNGDIFTIMKGLFIIEQDCSR